MPIVVEKLNYAYMQGSAITKAALTDISLRIEDGEFLGLIGHTGSGKSTFVQQLNGLLQPNSGTVHVDGREESLWAWYSNTPNISFLRKALKRTSPSALRTWA